MEITEEQVEERDCGALFAPTQQIRSGQSICKQPLGEKPLRRCVLKRYESLTKRNQYNIIKSIVPCL
ncbi:hypothetical protein ANCCAN_01713 [Ancylostoma caninum]|uniref:Uncharacterized protein n=1 Tax=Ancylostoma caninum TaxID=29170 RepID=A0A368HA93_ANCCA|nr:hypothetical protein ANCCAN_01713 [Ancylostoma caninum]